MKSDIHPAYYPNAKVKCACGNKFVVGSTLENIEVEICSACHPFFTGQDKMIDTAGRVERFKARVKAAEEKKEVFAAKKTKTSPAAEKKSLSRLVGELPKRQPRRPVGEAGSHTTKPKVAKRK